MGKKKIQKELLQGKHVLISFWSLESPPSLEFSKTIQQMYGDIKKSHGLQLLSVCIDSDQKKALEYVKKNQIRGWHGYADSWEHEMINEFGVRRIPALFLIDQKGLISMTPNDFQKAFRAENADLSRIVVDGISGKNAPTTVDEPSETSATGK